MTDVLNIDRVTKCFGGLTAVDNITLTIKEGEIFGLIGPNGAGKTTIFNLITAVYGLSEGEIRFFGDRIAAKDLRRRHSQKPFRIAQKGIARTFQNIRLFEKLTTYDNVYTACHGKANYTIFDAVAMRFTKKFRQQEKELQMKTEELLKLMGLWEMRDMVSVNLPYGFQRKPEIARALALEPKLLLLDEPAAGMNPEETISLMALIRDIRDRFGLSVLIIEHHMDLIMGLCDKIFVLNFGKALAEGTPEQVQNNPRVIEAYLGAEEEIKGENSDA